MNGFRLLEQIYKVMLTLLAFMHRPRLTRRDDGFTILELLVVMVVISILAGISIPLFLNQSRIAVDAGVKSDVRNTAGAVFNWMRNHPGVAVANTTDYLEKNGKLTISRPSDTKMGVQVDENGAYTVCAFDAGGNDYRAADKAWAFSSTTGKFDTAANLMGTDCSVPTTSTSGTGGGTSTSATPVWATSATLPNAEVNESYSRTLVANGQPKPTYFLSATSALPEGLTFNETSGILSGTPSSTGLYKFTVVAKNTQGVASREFTLRVATFTTAPEWNTDVQLPDGSVGTTYGTTLSAIGNPNPTFQLQTGSAFPAGLSLDAVTGKISGAPVAAGDSAFTVLAKNSKGSTPRTFFIHVASTPSTNPGGDVDPDPDAGTGPVGGGSTPPSSTDAAPDWKSAADLPDGTQASAYSATVTAESTPAATYALAAGSTLPTGLNLNKTSGVISGTPTVYGSFSFKIIAKNAQGSAARTFILVIERQRTSPTWSTAASLHDGEQGTAYAADTNAAGYPAPSYTVASGSDLPDGLSLNNDTGMISGTPTVYGSFMFAITAANSKGSANRTFFLNLAQQRVAPAWTTGANLTGGEQGIAYSTTVAATGVPKPTYAINSTSTLPAGLSLNGITGAISGTPTVYGNFSFVVSAINSKGVTDRTFNLTLIKQRVAPTFTGNAALPAAEVASPYTTTLTADGEPAPTFTVTSGSTLPAGLNLDATSGVLSGTPSANGSFSFFITATNSKGSANRSYTLNVAKTRVAPAFTSAGQLADGEQNTAYSTTITTSGEPAPSLAITSGAIPTGLSLNTTTGVLSGIPSVYGSFSFTLSATNSLASASRTFTLNLAKERVTPVYTTGTALPDAAQNSAYNVTLAATGEPAPTFALASGSTLPTGLNLSASGAITGTPGVYGSFSFTVTATNSKGAANRTFTLNVARQPVAPAFTTGATLAGGLLGEAYSQTIAASGYPDPTYTVTSGTLPAGLNLNATTGVLSGTPTATGQSTFAVTATSSAGTANRTFTLQINAKPVINTASLASGTINQSYSQSLNVSGVPTPTVSVTGLPAGLSYNSGTGTISGTPTAFGSFNVNVDATNSVGGAARSYTLTIAGQAATPTNVRATKLFGNQINYAWDAVTGASSYNVTVSGATTNGTSSSFTTTSTSASGVIGIGEYASALNVSVVAVRAGYANSNPGTGSISTPGRRINNADLTACPGLYYDQNTIVNGNCALTSFDGRWTLIMQGDGNLVEYYNDLSTGAVKPFFATNRGGTGNRLSVQRDANMVVYNSANVALTATNTYVGDLTGANLALGDSGDLKLRRNNDNAEIWRNISPVDNTNTYFMDYVGGSNVSMTNAGAEVDDYGNTQWSTYYGPSAGFTTEDKHDGNRSYKITTTGNNVEGFIIGTNFAANQGERMYITLWVKGTAGETWNIAGRTNAYAEGMGAYNFTTNGQWQLVNVLYTVPVTGVGQVFIQMRQAYSGSPGKVLYADSMSLYRGYPG